MDTVMQTEDRQGKSDVEGPGGREREGGRQKESKMKRDGENINVSKRTLMCCCC